METWPLGKVFDQRGRVGRSKIADGVDAQRIEPATGLRADAIDLARGQRPDPALDVDYRRSISH